MRLGERSMCLQNKYDLIVVGCGFCGSVIARLASEDCSKRVLIIEKRSHIAGNMYDEIDDNGFLVQKYGPHVFHTNNERVFHFISRFAEWEPYKVYYGVELDGKCIPAPFGFQAIKKLYNPVEAKDLIERIKKLFPNVESVPILELMNCSDERVSSFAEMLYQKNYKPYAAKQWNMSPEQLDVSVIARMPVIFSERTNYFTEKYEVLPKGGYTAFFEKMLKHELIEISLDVDATKELCLDLDKGNCFLNGEQFSIPIVYTGPLEELFGETQTLPYRSLAFEYKTFEQSDFQEVAILTYPQSRKYLRTTEFSKLTGKAKSDKTVVAFEYPVPYDKTAEIGNEPYYPILTEENMQKNDEYVMALTRIKNFFPCGRLADYRYYNMDQAVERAFEVFDKIKNLYW